MQSSDCMMHSQVLYALGDLDTLEAATKALQSGKLEGAPELKNESLGAQ